MKTRGINSTLMAAFIGAAAGGAAAADYKKKPLTLVDDGAITENVKGKVNILPANKTFASIL